MNLLADFLQVNQMACASTAVAAVETAVAAAAVVVAVVGKNGTAIVTSTTLPTAIIPAINLSNFFS